MLEIFEKSILVDPLTRLPNFFSLIKADAKSLFKENGAVILFDFIKFGEINELYGRDTGDMNLQILAHVITEELAKQKDAQAFRTDGDEFTIVLPGLKLESAKMIANRIRSKYTMEINRFDDPGIRELVFEYSEEMKSISGFYQLILQKSYEKFDDSNRDSSENGNSKDHRWIVDIIDSFTRRIQETLTNFNDAYVMAMADDISGLPNHRAGRRYLEHLIEECKMKSQCFSVMFIDGDNLKRYNQISYQAGNRMIRELSSILDNSIRKGDRIFRWLSGDEFLVVLPNVNCDNALKLAERTRKAVEDNTLDWTYPVTISIGVAHYTTDECDIEDIINKAEKANQFAKNLGKNRVVNWNKVYESNPSKDAICG